mmetsp:Transcript_31657/g.41925  ORF Transcript_31657/g.41925 Transcript_31657/m.41925 type:complete len:142 (+) Transcript_31657:21-446(+)
MEERKSMQVVREPIVYVNEENQAVYSKKGATFNLGRLSSYCKHGKFAERIGSSTPIYLAAVLEYLTFEMLDLAAEEACKEKKKRINPTHIMQTCKSDPELARLIQGTFCNAGFAPKVKPAAPRNGKKAKKVVDSDDEYMEE